MPRGRRRIETTTRTATTGRGRIYPKESVCQRTNAHMHAHRAPASLRAPEKFGFGFSEEPGRPPPHPFSSCVPASSRLCRRQLLLATGSSDARFLGTTSTRWRLRQGRPPEGATRAAMTQSQDFLFFFLRKDKRIITIKFRIEGNA